LWLCFLAGPVADGGRNVLYSLAGRLEMTTIVTQDVSGAPLSTLAVVSPSHPNASVLRADLVCAMPPSTPTERVTLVVDYQHAVALNALFGGSVVHADVTAAVKSTAGLSELSLLSVAGNVSACALFTIW
jgi:hypothetical protein